MVLGAGDEIDPPCGFLKNVSSVEGVTLVFCDF